MDRARWRNRFGPPSIVLGTALLLSAATAAGSIGTASVAAGRGQPPSAAVCPPPTAVAQSRNRQGPSGHGRLTLDEVMTAGGELIGRSLHVDTEAGGSAITLPTESFIGQPAGDLLVYTSYTAAAAGSTVHLVDLATGCDVIAVSVAEIVRSALIDPRGISIYIHSVTRLGRRDNGVQRFDLASSASTPVVPPLPPSDDFGPTFATELRWSLDGDALAVQSCGFEACRTRVLNVAARSIATFDAPGQGALIGLTEQHLLTFGACGGLPCSVISTDLSTAATTLLADAAWSAALAAGPGGTGIITIDTAAGTTEVVQ